MNWLWIFTVVVASAFCYFLGRFQEAALCRAKMETAMNLFKRKEEEMKLKAQKKRGRK